MHAASIALTSVVVHAGVLAAAAYWLERPVGVAPVPPRHDDLIEIAVISPPKVEPMQVAIVAATPTPAPAPAARGSAHHVSTGSVHTETPAAASATTHGTESHAAHGTGFMHMRGPDLKPDGDVMATIAAAGKPAPSPPHESGRLDDAPNGKAVIHDAVTTVTVDKDGSAHFHDKPDIEIHVPIVGLVHDLIVHPETIAHGVGDVVAEWYADPDAGKRYGRMQDLPRRLQAVEGGCQSFGDAMCDDPMAPAAVQRARETGGGGGLPIISGKADITAYLMHKAGIDPFASRKLALLDATRDERAARGDKYRTEQLERSAELMRNNLERLWASQMTAAERRAVLFELWDECAEGDGAIGEAGERARVTVIGWIRAKHVVYSAAELAELDQHRASQQEFVP